MHVQPYLMFNGRCEEAFEFYKKAAAAQSVMMMRFGESPDQSMCGAATKDKIMHMQFRIGNTELMASDGRCEGKLAFEGFALSLSVPSAEEADRLFAALGDGGQVQMPLTKTFFSERFGMVADRFGVSWMIIVQK